ncbi:DUF2073 domain-containing protein [Candidatus Halobonum tyrrellensis]|uniref:DUF2073 domain-containing protein n=1 Tax=Candidatus Halobonum tyrrellensis G22 TaxID=1324957 RepID=V4HB57_9EURY|nr:DUF2073 domain-containing protein [Candidatus Halobonum tyrrellensis]ESP87925.1 hypothetical protein K933_11431 [Candidatus Halobonum tyrrellensis G22]
MPEATTPEDGDDGVRIDLISGARMEGLASMEKIRLILDSVRDGDIVVLEEGLSPEEESRLIEVTMTEISPDDFTGIEIETYPKPDSGGGSFLGRIMGKDETAKKLTVIGPANQIQTLHKDENLITALVSRK